MFTAVLAVKAVMLALEAWSKRGLLGVEYQTLPKETTSSILSRGLFVWMNTLFIQGVRTAISFEDLGTIDSKLGTAAVHRRIHQEWSKQDLHLKWPLLRSLWRAVGWSALSPVPARLCYGGFMFAQPFLIHRATQYLGQHDAGRDIGYGLIVATACIYLGIAISTALFKHQLYRHITLVRGALVSIIYSETLSTENILDDPSAVVTLMSTDVDRICQGLFVLQDLWSRPLELAVGVALLALQIGWLAVMPLLVVLVSIGADSRVTLTISRKVKMWNDAVQQRISLTADILASMKSVKVLGLTRPVRAMLQNERLRELSFQAKFRHATVWLNTLGNVPPALAAAVTFIAYAIKARVQGSGSLNTSQAFTSLALISLVTTPATEILTAYPGAASCLGCLSRIEAHLMRTKAQRRSPDATEMNVLPNEQNGFGHLTVSMLTGSHHILRDLDSILQPQTFTFIIGSSGSGKSTLLKAVMAELGRPESRQSGGRAVYCEQIPWIFTGTIRQNICGMDVETFDEAWYRSVLTACALQADLLTLPRGDLTYVDGQAASLNVGQKQRIVLARTLYQRPRLVLLDDVLSALDRRMETLVMKGILGRDGLLRKLSATGVIVVHNGRFAEIADNLITLDDQRNVNLVLNKPRSNEDIFRSDSDGPEFEPDFQEPTSSNEHCADNQTTQETNPAKEPSRPDGDFSVYAFYFRSMSWPWVVLFFSVAAVQTVCYHLSQVILQWWTADGGMDAAKWMSLYFMLACGNAVFYGVAVWAMFLKLVPESAANLHRILLDTLTNATYLFLTKTDVGITLNRFSQDMTLIESQLPTGVLCTTIYLFWTLGSLALICNGSSWMALMVPVVLLALFIIQWVYLRTSRRLRVIELELRSPLYSHFLETIKGTSSIRSLHWEQLFTDSMIRKLDDSQIPYYLLYCAQRWLQLVLDLVIAALAVIVMTLAVSLRSSTNAGSLGLSLNNILSFNDILSFLLQYWTQLEVSLGSIARIREFVRDTPAESISSVDSHLPPASPTHGNIELRNVSAGYGTSRIALQNITISVRAGEKIGLCGRTGSGKSSLLLALLRLLEPIQGSASIDGLDLSTTCPATIRERILTISQEPFLVQQKSVRFNMDPDGRCTDEQLVSAFSEVTLWPILEKKGGLNAVVTSDFLSQAQKQLFSIARALLLKAEKDTSIGGEKQKNTSPGGVLLLDQATSKFDTAMEKFIQRLIKDEFFKYTIITVASPHGLDAILDSDRIVILDGGRVLEFDAPETLLARKSAFRKMFDEAAWTEL